MRPYFQPFNIVSSLTALRAGAIRLRRPNIVGCYRITDTKVRQFLIYQTFLEKIYIKLLTIILLITLH